MPLLLPPPQYDSEKRTSDPSNDPTDDEHGRVMSSALQDGTEDPDEAAQDDDPLAAEDCERKRRKRQRLRI